MLAFWYYLHLKIKVDTAVHRIYFDSNYHIKHKFASKFTQLVTHSNILSFEVVHKCQHCQLCVLREN